MNDQLRARIEDAAQQTENWRKFYAIGAYVIANPHLLSAADHDCIRELEDNAFRGFRLPLESLIRLKDVIEQYNDGKTPDKQVNSARIYLAKKTTVGDPVPPPEEDLHVYVVPVVGGDLLEAPIDDALPQEAEQRLTPGPSGSDLLWFNMKYPEGVGAEMSIYNFSQPCPKQCDPCSILYSRTNPVEAPES